MGSDAMILVFWMLSIKPTMSANLEDPSVATGLEKVNPHPNSQEG